MEAILLDDREIESLIERRREMGADRYDEVWNGVYVMAPLATNEHQRIAGELTRAFLEIAGPGSAVLPGANVSDRDEGWRQNYRCPDVVVVLASGLARDAGTHWVGGPDLVVEVVSPNDRSEAKVEFYRRIGVREVLLIDRDTKGTRLYRGDSDRLEPVEPGPKESIEIVTLSARIARLEGVARLRVSHPPSGRSWTI